jgi:uncharacterized protein YukE
MKFDMGVATLTTLGRQTQGASSDLGTLIRQMVDAVTPLEGRFNGAGRAAFDNFKIQADQIAVDLNTSLASILGAVRDMDAAFSAGDAELAGNARTSEGAAPFDAARFSGTR